MSTDVQFRTITLLLQGGHLIKLGGAVDVAELLRALKDAGSDTIEIASGSSERLVLRRDALLGIMDSLTFSESPPEDKRVAAPFFRMENFLTDNERRMVMERILSRECHFQRSLVTTGLPDVRNSILLREDEYVAPIFREKIRKIANDVTEALSLYWSGAPVFDNIECQITAHLDGGFYHAHTDNGCADTASRVISYVYYLQSRPSGFFGGELKLYEPRLDQGANVTGSDYCLVKPIDNSIVFFASQLMHEVLPTYVPSKAFSDSRFTVNGWIRLKSAEGEKKGSGAS